MPHICDHPKRDKPISNELFTLDFKNDKKIKALFKKIFSVWVAKNSGYQFECMSLIYKIFAHIEGSSCVNQNKNDVIVPALEYIDDNFLKQKISVKHLAQICKISESYLKKVFVKNFGVPPVKYIIGLKINYACDLMQSGIYSVSRISEMCGYADVYYFSHQFKEYMGVSPTEFKNKYKSSK